MVKLGQWIIKNHKKILIISVLTALFFIYEAGKLEIKMEITDLLPKNDSTVKTYNYALDNFENLDNTIIGIKGNKNDIIKFIDYAVPYLSKRKYVSSIRYKIEKDYIIRNFFILENKEDMSRLKKSFTADNFAQFIEGINNNFEKGYINSEQEDKISKDKKKLLYFLNYIEKLIKNINTDNMEVNLLSEFFTGNEYILSPNEDLGIIILKSQVTIDQMDILVEFINKLEKDLKEEAKSYNVNIIMTGPQVLSRDEMVQSQKDTKLTTLLSIMLIFLIFLKAFGRIRYSLISIIPLSMGIFVSLGATRIFFGKLNMMTAMMGAILIGLGIDYAIHMITIYLEYRHKGKNKEESVLAIFQKGIKGISAGALTTSVGFLLFGLSSFPGFSEFGIVLGGGILIVFICTLFLLPSILISFGKIKKNKSNKTRNFSNLEDFIQKNKKSVFTVSMLTVIFLSYHGKKIEFDKNMMNIQMKNLKSLEFNKEIIDKFDMSSDNTIAFSNNIQSAFLLKEKLDKLKTVGEIENISRYLPPKLKQKENIDFIKTIKKEINTKAEKEINIQDLKKELYRLEDNIIELSDLAYIGGENKLYEKADWFLEKGLIKLLISNLEKDKIIIEKNQLEFINKLKSYIKNSNDNFLEINSLPANIKRDYIGKDGKFISTIYPKGDFWNIDFQKLHRNELKTLNEDLTGTTLIFLKVVDAEIEEGRKVLLYTFGGIFFILLIDLKSFKYSFIAILPMFAAVASTFGLLELLGFKLNMVNIIGIPLIVGIGVDDGVHILHRYILEGKNLRPALRSTGKAVLTTTITTAAAFGTMIFAKYRGFSTFGILLITGVFFAYFYTLIFMTSLLSIIDDKERS